MKTKKYLLCCWLSLLTLDSAHSLPVRVPQKAAKYIKLILPKQAKSVDDLHKLVLQSSEGTPTPLFREHFWTRSDDARRFMQTLKLDDYHLYEPKVGLGFDGFPVGYLPPERIDPKLLEDVERHNAGVRRHRFLLIPGFQEHRENLPSSVEELEQLFADNPKLKVWEDHCKWILRDMVRPEAHGVMVASLILDLNPVGKSSVGKLSDIIFMEKAYERTVYFGQGYPDVFNFSYKLEFDEILAETDPDTRDLLEFIPEIERGNRVIEVRENHKHVNELLNNLSKQALVVVGVGNEGKSIPNPNLVDLEDSLNLPFVSAYEYRHLPDLYEHAIFVGSISPSGRISDFSNHGEHLTILAPGELVSTKSIGGKLVAVDGTSVAAPQVTAALADTLALLPDLTTAQAKHLLLQTAFYYEETAAGILDHYYLVRVAYEIAERLKIGGKSLNELVFSDEVYMDSFKQRRQLGFLQARGFYYLDR